MEIRDLQLWQTFLIVAQEKNFSKAGKILHTNAPNVTKRISTLEKSLGTRLFNRTTRTVSLTQEGEALLPSVQLLLDQARELEAKASDRHELSGLIRLTCLNGLAQRWLAPLLIEFQAANPLVRFEVLLTDRMIDLVQDQVDLAIRIQEPKGADFIFRELRPNRLVVCASPAYLKSAPAIRTPSDLMKHPLLTLSVHQDLKFVSTGERLGDFFSRRSIICESGPYLTDLALMGGGIAVRARYDVDNFLRDGQLVECLSKHKIEYFRSVYLVIPQKRYLTNRVRTFSDYLMRKRWKGD
jgi:DNA-binding transcriptional LysR family regulator